MRRIVILICSISMLLLVGCSSEPGPGDDWSTLDPFLKKLEKKDQFSGVVLVAEGDKLLFQQAYGLANREEGIRNTTDTQFNLASITKMVTAVAIGRLVDQGKLSLDDRIGSYISGLPELSRTVTLRQLLSHTSGFGDTPDKDMRTTNEYLDYICKQPMLFEPGTKFNYSNSGYLLLGAVIEKVSGQSYFDFVKNEVLEPAGMKHTIFFDKSKLPSSAAIGYEKETSKQWKASTDKLAPMGRADGGVYATAEDLWRFWLALQSDKLLSRETRVQFTKAVTPTYFSEHVSFGYGFMVEDWNGVKLIGHNGGGLGVSTWTSFYPSTGLITVVLSNYDQAVFPVEERLRKHVIPGFEAPPIPSAPLLILVNGKPVSMPPEPIPSENFTVVPVESIVKHLGIEVKLDMIEKSYVVANEDDTWILKGRIGTKNATLNGDKVELMEKAMVSDGQLMLDARSLAKLLGGKALLEGNVLQFWIK